MKTKTQIKTLGNAFAENCGTFLIKGYNKIVVREELLGLDWITKRTARHEYFMSATPRQYSYGNRGTGEETYDSKGFSPLVGEIMEKMNADLDTNFNVCFLNKYDNEKQHLGWHADDFEGMRADEPIAVLSQGASREIWVKPKEITCPQCEGRRSFPRFTRQVCSECNAKGVVAQTGVVPLNQRILLDGGDLFIMPEGYQDTHLHRIPKHSRPCGWRISMTFRSFG